MNQPNPLLSYRILDKSRFDRYEENIKFDSLASFCGI